MLFGDTDAAIYVPATINPPDVFGKDAYAIIDDAILVNAPDDFTEIRTVVD